MDQRNILIWAIGIVLFISVMSNTGSFTGNVVNKKEVSISVLTPVVDKGSLLHVSASYADGDQEFYILNSNGEYIGHRFFSRSSKCERRSFNNLVCSMQYGIPVSGIDDGKYYVQAKDRRTGILTGNKAPFIITG